MRLSHPTLKNIVRVNRPLLAARPCLVSVCVCVLALVSYHACSDIRHLAAVGFAEKLFSCLSIPPRVCLTHLRSNACVQHTCVKKMGRRDFFLFSFFSSPSSFWGKRRMAFRHDNLTMQQRRRPEWPDLGQFFDHWANVYIHCAVFYYGSRQNCWVLFPR
jgi:hypothetical protein